ncbi:DUF6313 family protein [Streptomyces sp. NPDC005897]|uniref:DUF6313 family protein n=1 Tax=Streptomyces sp. NPDC005897 TaxID=3157081 RepID=UPI0034103CFE
MGGRRIASLGNFLHWLIHHGLIVICIIGGWYCIAWGLLGWSDAWDLLVGRATPRNAPYPWLSWPLSVVGWLAVPAFVGAVVGYWVTSRVEDRRTATEEDFINRIAARVRGGEHS